VRRRDQQLHRGVAAQRGEIDQVLQQLPQGIDAQRVELVGREQMGGEIEGERPEAAALERGMVSPGPADGLPELGEQVARRPCRRGTSPRRGRPR
jgi:hypothetical protein